MRIVNSSHPPPSIPSNVHSLRELRNFLAFRFLDDSPPLRILHSTCISLTIYIYIHNESIVLGTPINTYIRAYIHIQYIHINKEKKIKKYCSYFAY